MVVSHKTLVTIRAMQVLARLLKNLENGHYKPGTVEYSDKLRRARKVLKFISNRLDYGL